MFRFRSIRTKLMLFTALVILLTVVVFIAVVIDLHRRSFSDVERINIVLMENALQQEWDQKISDLTTLLAKKLVEPMHEFDIFEMDYLARLAMKGKGILYVYVHDEEGRVQVDGTEESKLTGSMLTDQLTKGAIASKDLLIQRQANIFDISAPIMLGGKRLGIVRIGFSPEGIQETISQMIKEVADSKDQGIRIAVRNTLLGALVIVIIAIVVGAFYVRRLLSPINMLVRGTKRIATGDLTYRIETESEDEIGHLADSFNLMVDKLEYVNKNLERRVEIRTKELQGEIYERIQAEEALRETEERYRSIFEKAPVSIVLLDKDGKVVDINPYHIDHIGKGKTSKKEYLGEDFATRPSIVNTGIVESYTRVIKGESLDLKDVYFPTTTGGTDAYFNVKGVPFFKNGKVIGAIIIHENITERKRIEEELRFRNIILSTQQETSIDGILVVDNKGKWLSFNQRFIHMWGITPEVEEARSSERALPSVLNKLVDPEQFVARVNYLYEHRSEKSYDEIALVNGVTFERYSAPMFGPDGEYYGRVWYYHEITVHKRMEETLRESEAKYRMLIERLPLGITITKQDETTYYNPKGLEMLGLEPSDNGSIKPSDVYVDPKDREELLKHLNNYGHHEYEYWLRRKDRKKILVRGHSVAIRDENGQLDRFESYMEDITERIKMEAELLRISKLESIGILSAGIAHDFNNILATILVNTSLAKIYAESEDKISEVLTNVEKASMRAKDLTQQLLTFSKGGAPIKKTVAIPELIKDSIDFALRGSNVKCEFSTPDDVWPINADEGQISQVINNLIINAYQAMPQGGTIKVRAENVTVGAKHFLPLQEGKYIKICVEDQGIGIPQEQLDKVFDPFFTTKKKGSGLGLTTSYSIISNHDGYISVESELGVGTTFHIYLPATSKAIQIKEDLEEKPLAGKGKILIMDDEEDIRRLLEIDPEVKAIVSSGYSNDPVLANFRQYGFSSFVAKPYKVEELSKTLHEVIMVTSE